MKLGGDQKEKRRTYGAQCQDQEAKTATWNVLGSVLSIATEKMLSSASLFHSVSMFGVSDNQGQHQNLEVDA